MRSVARLQWTILGALIAGALVSSLGAVLLCDQSWGALWLNLGTEMAGAAVAYCLLELVIGRRERQETEQRTIEERKATLVTQMGSDVRDVAVPAADELRRLGWLTDGSLQKANLSGADLNGADLSGADLHGADLSGADLSGANLNVADLSGARLSWADLSEANLRLADLSGANLAKATVTNEQLAEAGSLKGATMPDGTKHE